MGAVLLASLAPMLAVGCDDDTPAGSEGDDSDGGGPGEERFEMPYKSKVDLLLVIDDSPAMCEGQDALARNLAGYADELVRNISRNADIRVAVVSTDIRHPERGGRFLTGPASSDLPEACAVGAAAVSLDCPADAGPILKLSEIVDTCPVDDTDCVSRTFTQQLACRARVGVAGDGFRAGLESMRQALSCGGPNAALFGVCCVDGVYRPDCLERDIAAVGGRAEFMRPDAILQVVVVSNGDDCSAPGDAPELSIRGVCRPDGTADSDGDGVPDIYGDSKVCPDSRSDIQACADRCAEGGADCDQCRRTATERACFVRDCGLPPCAAGQTPEANQCALAAGCADRRCEVDRGNLNNCEWFRSNLTPVADYYNFLVGLKARLREQLAVATIVGKRAYTEDGDLIVFNPPTTPDQLPCLDADGFYDPHKRCSVNDDCPGDANTCIADARGELRCTGEGADLICCRGGGACVGNVRASCESAAGVALQGRRYLELSELFDRGFSSGTGCPPGTEDDPAACASICNDTWVEPLVDGLSNKVGHGPHGTYCLETPVACSVAGARACATEGERADPANYPVSLTLQCREEALATGDCDPREVAAIDPQRDCEIQIDRDYCVANMLLECAVRLPFGSEMHLSFTPGDPIR